MTDNNCGFPDGVTHQHVEACYQAGRRDALVPQPVTDMYVQGILFGAELARSEARWQEEQHRRGVPGTEYARDRALQVEAALRSVAEAVTPVGWFVATTATCPICAGTEVLSDG